MFNSLYETPTLLILLSLLLAVLLTALASFAVFIYKVTGLRRYFSNKQDDSNEKTLYADVAYFYEKGKRKKQEDSWYISPLEEYKNVGVLACIADGIGGLRDGAQASNEVTDRIASVFPLAFDDSDANADRIKQISNDLYNKYKRAAGSTLAMMHIFEDKMHFYSVGDSEIILIRNGRATVLNPKQNYSRILINRLVAQRQITKDAYTKSDSKALIDFVGNSNPNVIHSRKNSPLRMHDGDTIIICSDGVTDTINVKLLPMFIHKSAKKTAEMIKFEVRHKAMPKQDNFTCIVIKLNRYFM